MPRRPAPAPVVAVAVLAGLLLLSGWAGPAAGAPRPAMAAGGGRWGWPVLPAPRVVARFDPPPQPWRSGHRGVDLAVGVGSVVRAAGAGVVSYAGSVAGKPVVVVDHGGLRTTYEPVVASVTVGDHVAAGAVIGRTAAYGGHCGGTATCLHWGLLRGSTYLDPLRLLGRRPIVLKPP